MITIERNFVFIFGEQIYRPENMVPGDWLAMWDRFENSVNYQEAFEAGVESVNSEVEDLEGTIEDLRGEISELNAEVSDLENEIDNLELEIERLGGTVE
jgi:predicted nuclease with TOPRIM domain